MSKFERSEWAEKKHAKEFVENADIYILERGRLFGILKSFYTYFLKNRIKNRPVKVLDLGCGDGALTKQLLKVDHQIKATLVDGSLEMLKNAHKSLKSYSNLVYIHKTFQELLEEDVLESSFDFAVSSLAIHHLSTADKESLFDYVYHHLNEGGFFLNIDVVLAPAEQLEDWYRQLWEEWIVENEAQLGFNKTFSHIPNQYKNNPDNHPDTLKKQIDALKYVGFKQVDCYYKYGVFSIYGGKK
jgi:tRNA (cmo5U34)-methyltransferase